MDAYLLAWLAQQKQNFIEEKKSKLLSEIVEHL